MIVLLVQLGGLEPPTSCSTDRRSNQLSYNCILARRALGCLKGLMPEGGWTGRKLGATARFGKAAEPDIWPLQSEENSSIGWAGSPLPGGERSDCSGARMRAGAIRVRGRDGR